VEVFRKERVSDMNNLKDYALLQQNVKAAWNKLPPDLRARLEPRIRAAHEYTLAVRNRTVSRDIPPPPQQLVMLHSLLHDDPDGLVASAMAPETILTFVGPDGQIFFGDVQYDSTDVRWAYIIVALAETRHQTPPFKIPSKDIPIPDDTTVTILGDWGGWNGPAQQVAKAAQAANAQYFVHLGDVYYAGTNSSKFPQEPFQQKHFLDVWPGPPGRSLALNSNHDMYAHATGFSNTTLPAPAFSAQMGANCFALCNKYFRIVGLDSAYYSPDDLYDTGSLGGPAGKQAQFLKQQADLAAASGQNLVLITHHNGLSTDGRKPEPLWKEVADQLSAFSGKSVCWYWGHVHVGAIYKPQVINGITIYPRCCGHSCIPWGIAKDLSSPQVQWSEQEVLGPGHNYFVTNGYATLALSGASMTETFYDQSGKSQSSGRWPQPKAEAATSE
jgi:hypothetical protein